MLVDSGLNLIFASELEPRKVKFGWLARLVLWLLAASVLANGVAVLAEEVVHWTLPDDPNSYRLFEDLLGG